MSDYVKWALLAAALVALLALVAALPVSDLSLLGSVGSYLNSLVSVCGSALGSARALVNNLLFPPVRTFLSGLLIWLFCKYFLLLAIRITKGIYSFIFK